MVGLERQTVVACLQVRALRQAAEPVQDVVAVGQFPPLASDRGVTKIKEDGTKK